MALSSFATGGRLSRRALALSLFGLPLAACFGNDSASVRFRVIAKLLYKGQMIEASTVMECQYWRVTRSLIGMGGGTKVYGEALIFDLPGGGTLYFLPFERQSGSGSLHQFYEFAVLKTLSDTISIGSLSDNDLNRLRTAEGRYRLNYFGRYPAIVAFRDEANPKSVYEIDPGRMNEFFPGVSFYGIELEITKEPVTAKLRQRLKWLNSSLNIQIFDRQPNGQSTPYRDLPIGFLIQTTDFFGNGSWQ